jgi:NAD(P)-dependent dehydrogenase (short-subunit alcohol dehydrogenase family)
MTSSTSIDFSRLAPPAGSRIAVVGGCGGIGRALVHACRVLDLRTAVLDLPASLHHRDTATDILRVPLDVTSEEDVNKAFDGVATRWAGLDVLVFVTGIAIIPPCAIEDLTAVRWDELMYTNLRGAWFCVRAALPLMKKGGGSIVTIASSLAFNPNRGFSAYVATKGGLVSFTKAVAAENAPKIRANVVAPSAVDTAFLKGGTGPGGHRASDAWFRENSQAYLANIPLGRLARPHDVVGPILFLAGPASGYITGQVIHVNGGRITP